MTERLRHTVAYRARFDECDPAGFLRTSGLLRFAQDCAWIHSESLGFDREWYASRGLWWVVRCVDLQVEVATQLGATLHVTTQVAAWRRVWARRRTDVAGPDGSRVAFVHTDWVLTDARGMPTRVPRDVESVFGGLGTFTPARVTLPAVPDGALETRFTVREHDLDPMGHVNNARYVDWLEEGVAAVAAAHDRQVPRRYRLEYVAPAAAGAELRGSAWRTPSGAAYRLCDAVGTEVLKALVEPA